MSSNFAQDLATQSWTLYGIGMFLIAYRTFARWRRVGSMSKLASDDWIMCTAVVLFYTGLMVTLNNIASGGGSNLYFPGQFETFTPDEIQARIEGSKIVIVSEQCMLNCIWSIKAVMLLMYARIFVGTNNHKWIKIVAICTFLSWLACQITFFSACRPFSGYWAMPPPSPQCSGLENYAIVQITFNVFSDLLILALPIPIIIKLSLPIKQKIGLGLLFSMGSFVIIAAVVNKYFTFKDIYSPEYMFWYTREASVAVYVASLPGIWPLLREHIGFLRDQTTNLRGTVTKQNSSNYGNLSKAPKGGSRVSKSQRSRTRSTVPDSDEVELGTSFGKSGVHSSEILSNHTPSERAHSFFQKSRSARQSQDSDDRAINDVLHGRIRVERKVETRRNSWDSTRLEAGHPDYEGNIVSIVGGASKR